MLSVQGIRRSFPKESGSPAYMQAQAGLSPEQLAQTAWSLLAGQQRAAA